MSKKREVFVVLGDDVKERIAKANLSGFIDLLAELIAKERIKEINTIKTETLEITKGPK